MIDNGWTTVPDTFLALDPIIHNVDDSPIVVLPVPYDAATSYKSGSREGPRAIIRASREMEEFDLELGWSPSILGIFTSGEIEPHSGGPEAMANRVSKVIAWYLKQNKLTCMLGGDHSLTIGAVKSFALAYPELSVLFLDAHTDFADEYQGSKFNHACSIRRSIEFASGVLVGVRSMQEGDHNLLAAHNPPVFPRHDQPIVEFEEILSSLKSNVYISVDLDVFDPSIMSAVGNPEPGGMEWWEVLQILKQVCSQRNIVGFDIMELSPPEGPEACAYTAAKLAYKLMGYIKK